MRGFSAGFVIGWAVSAECLLGHGCQDGADLGGGLLGGADTQDLQGTITSDPCGVGLGGS